MVRALPCHGRGHRFEPDLGRLYGVLAQLGEHLPYKQRVIGSSPIGSIYRLVRELNFFQSADVAQLAEICNQQVTGSIPAIGFIWVVSRVAKGDRL